MIGVLCGLRSEAKIADRLPDVLVGCSAANQDRALALAQHMVKQGANRLISFGLAAGLSQDLAAGDLILGGSVMTAAQAWEADTAWNDAMIEAMPSLMCVPVWGCQYIAAKAQDKNTLYRRTGCLAADMESRVVASVAHEAGIPFNVVRAISDPYDMDLPPAALVPLKEDGTVDLRAVFQSVKEKPAQLPTLVTLALNTSHAMRALKQAVRVMKERG